MKKTVRVLALVMALATVLCVFAACGKTLKGKYSADFLGTGTTLEFDGKDVRLAITVTLIGEVAAIEGTYKIDGDEISFDFVDDDEIENDKAKEVLAKFSEPVSFEEGDDYIKVAGVKYTRVDKD